MMRLLAALLLFPVSAALAQSVPPVSSSGAVAPLSFQTNGYSSSQQTEYIDYVRKCLARQKEPVRGLVEMEVTIGVDGMIVGDPTIQNPIDSDAFRQDTKTALANLHQCEPFIVNPFAKRNRTWFKQVFRFSPEKSVEEPPIAINAMIRDNFRKCWTASQTGPTIWLRLSYKADGTYASPPMLENPEKTEAYSRAAEQVLRQVNTCPPLKFAKDQYERLVRHKAIRWSFPSIDSAKAAGSRKS